MKTLNIKPCGYWTKERCQVESLKYNSKVEFAKKSGGAHSAAYKNGWLNEICNHMIPKHKPKGYWTKEQCHKKALCHMYRTDFAKKDRSAYNVAWANNWLDDICSHMLEKGNKEKKLGYKMIFKSPYTSRLFIYVGTTVNFQERLLSHLFRDNDNLRSSISDYELELKHVYVYHDFKPSIESKKLERDNIKFHRSEDKYIVLNKSKGGESGGSSIWTYDICKDAALKCNNSTEFANKFPSAYVISNRKGWMKKINTHFDALKKTNNYWNKKRCHEEALKYKTHAEFCKNSRTAYFKCAKNNWLSDVCSHMKYIKLPNGYYTKEKCHEISITCNSRNEFRHKNFSAYSASLKNKWIDDICSHMKSSRTKHGYYNDKVNCHNAALKCTSKKEFGEKYPGAYGKAISKNWINDICSHMDRPKAYNYFWTKDECMKVALLCKTKKEFRTKYPSAESTSRKNGWFNDMIKHMTLLRTPKNSLTKERCHRAAMLCNTSGEFKSKYPAMWQRSYRMKWLNDITSHMKNMRNEIYLTKEKCMELSLQCKSKSEMAKRFGGAYNLIRKNNWNDMMYEHMK